MAPRGRPCRGPGGGRAAHAGRGRAQGPVPHAPRPPAPRGGRGGGRVGGGGRGRLGLLLRPAKHSVELHPPVEVDKGTVVDELVAGLAAACLRGRRLGRPPGLRRPRPVRGRGRRPRCGSRCPPTRRRPSCWPRPTCWSTGPRASSRCCGSWPEGPRPSRPARSPPRPAARRASGRACGPRRVAQEAGEQLAPLVGRHREGLVQDVGRCRRRRTARTASAPGCRRSQAPASGDRASTASRSLTRAPSEATRLRPSRIGFTSSTSARRSRATERGWSSSTSSTIGVHVGVPKRALTSSTMRCTSAR